MGNIARYRLFLTFLGVPIVVVVLIVVLLNNVLRGGDEEPGGTIQAPETPALVAPTRALVESTSSPATVAADATVTPTPSPLPVAASTPTPGPPPPPTPTPTAAPTITPDEYEVQPDDTLSDIAELFGLTTEELAEINEIENVDDIRVGDKLIIPQPASGGQRTPRPTATATPTPIPAIVDADEGLNARADTTTDSEVLEVLPSGAEVLLTGERVTIDDIEWVALVDGGWVQSQYLTIEGE